MGVLRDAARALYHLPDRILHPLRRRGVERSLRGPGAPDRILFVCVGNICRSPYAERVLRRRMEDGPGEPPVIESAGFLGPGRPSPRTAREVARDRGIDLSGHTSRPLAGDLLSEADLVFVMDSVQRRAIRRKTGRDDVFLLGDLDPRWTGRRLILDPVEKPREVFESVYDRIDRCVDRLAGLLTETEE